MGFQYYYWTPPHSSRGVRLSSLTREIFCQLRRLLILKPGTAERRNTSLRDTSAPANEPVQPFTDNKNKYKTTACTNAILTNHTYPKPRAKQSNPPQQQHKCHMPTNADHFGANSVTRQKQNSKSEKKNAYYRNKRAKES